jgi:hypothetical protein
VNIKFWCLVDNCGKNNEKTGRREGKGKAGS